MKAASSIARSTKNPFAMFGLFGSKSMSFRATNIVAEQVFCYRNNLVGFATKISFLSLSCPIQLNIPVELERKRLSRAAYWEPIIILCSGGSLMRGSPFLRRIYVLLLLFTDYQQNSVASTID